MTVAAVATSPSSASPPVPRRREAEDGPNNVADAGICHLGKKTGGEPVCGARRAHVVYDRVRFAELPQSARCKRCEVKFEAWERIRKKCEAAGASDEVVRAAGLLITTPDDQALFLRRSGLGDHEGEWCLPGGVVEGEEIAEEAALREANEEISWTPEADEAKKMTLVSRETSDEDVDFATFRVSVAAPFVPTLNDEHDGWAWAPISSPPQPTHPGVERTLAADAANQATKSELRSEIKYPPEPASGGATRAINVSMENGGVRGSLRYAPEAQEFENSGGRKTANDEEPKTLYLSRPLTNASELIAWAKSQGVKRTLPAEDMHVTIAYSKKPVDWNAVGRSDETVAVEGGPRSVTTLGVDGAVVLKFESADISRRWRDVRTLGGEWQYETYQPHVTITYDAGDAKLVGTKTPYDGSLEFGPERLAEVKKNWRDDVRMTGGAADCLALDESSTREFDLDGRMRVSQANISKANVCPYLGSEIPGYEELGLEPSKIYRLLRDPEELEKAAPTFNGVQLLMRHVPVSADDHQPWDVVGAVGTDAVFEKPYLKNSLTVWTQAAIDAIESEAQKELSSAYHYRPDMTPGKYEGEDYDGVMRDIVGNHVALVKEGRAGADVVVGDSAERLNMKKEGLSRRAGITVLALASFLRPRLAQDAIVDLRPVVAGLTAKNFGEQKKTVLERLTESLKGKLAQDATIGEVAELLDMIEAHGVEGGEDEEMPEPMMDAAEKVGEKFAEKDAMDAEPLAKVEEFLKDKLSDEDLQAVCAMLRGGGEVESGDEDPKLKELGAAGDELQEDPNKGKAADEPPPFKGRPNVGGGMDSKKFVSQAAMDAALEKTKTETAAETTAAVLRTQREIREAERAVRPWVGDVSVACDSADDVYRAALRVLGVPKIDKMHPSAYPHVLAAQPLPGAKKVGEKRVAADAASSSSFAERHPEAARIGLA